MEHLHAAPVHGIAPKTPQNNTAGPYPKRKSAAQVALFKPLRYSVRLPVNPGTGLSTLDSRSLL